MVCIRIKKEAELSKAHLYPRQYGNPQNEEESLGHATALLNPQNLSALEKLLAFIQEQIASRRLASSSRIAEKMSLIWLFATSPLSDKMYLFLCLRSHHFHALSLTRSRRTMQENNWWSGWLGVFAVHLHVYGLSASLICQA